MCSSAVGLVTAKVTSFQTTRSRCLWLAGICVVLLAGCAGTPPTLPGDRKRVAQKIKARIDARKVPNTASSEPRSFQVVLRVTRYQKGNRFARAMLAGLGQLHLEGTISVYQMPADTLVEEFDMQKTFAWGGIYGASTSIEEIEDTFAYGVAATVTGQPHTAPKAKS